MGTRRGKTIQRGILMILVVFLSLSCTLFGRTSPPPGAPPQGAASADPATPTAPVIAEPAEPTALPLPTAVPAGQVASLSAVTRSQGEVAFSDPLAGRAVAVTVVDEQTRAPLDKIQVTLASNGAMILLIAVDPTQKYAPVVEEIAYEGGQSRQPGGARLAAPAPVAPLAVVLAMVTFLQVWETGRSAVAFFNDLPALESWSESVASYCLRPDQVGNAKEVVLNAGFLLLGGWMGKAIGKLAKTQVLLIDEASLQGLAEVFTNLLQEQTGLGLDQLIDQQGAYIVRWTEYRIQGTLTYFARPDGFCLEPLDASDPQSILDWVNYGLANSEPYALTSLPMADQMYYTNYLEGGQGTSPARYTAELNRRLPASAPVCDGYTFEDDFFKIWTHNWEPDWQMTEMCYIGCSPINPPYESDRHAFFFVEDGGQWKLRALWLNDWELFSFGRPYPITPCGRPVAEAPGGDALQQSACPGAPPQRMEVGQPGQVCTRRDNVALRKGPARSAEVITRLNPGAEFRVVGGPACADDWSWWQIALPDGRQGWIAEGGDSSDPYFICPLE